MCAKRVNNFSEEIKKEMHRFMNNKIEVVNQPVTTAVFKEIIYNRQ